MNSVFKHDAPTFVTVKFWIGEFKSGRNSFSGNQRSRRPKTATAR